MTDNGAKALAARHTEVCLCPFDGSDDGCNLLMNGTEIALLIAATPEPAPDVVAGGHSLLQEALEWIAVVAITGAKAEDADRWLREHDDGRGDWVFGSRAALHPADPSPKP